MTDTNNNRKIALQLSGVKKRYVLGQIGGRSLQAELQSWWARKRGKEDPNTKIGQEQRLVGKSFMALNGIDLTIYKGEAVGIIGSNGAGKSTMLKLISRVTAPTEGEIELYGRVASMLEVGTGFNGEMTGRENIYMNGAILGMSKAEIDAKMEQIIEFSEVRDFIDTPVKRYSSGMYVKLAFSVAAHLDNEIMIMDEVLAVGDMAFQKKCLKKMRSVAIEEGRTVLYVSHNMNTIRSLCTRCLVLDQGKVIYDGDVEEAITIYTNSKDALIKSRYIIQKDNQEKEVYSDLAHIEEVVLSSADVAQGEDLEIDISLQSDVDLENPVLRCIVTTISGEPIGLVPSEGFRVEKGRTTQKFLMNTAQIAPGSYFIDIMLYEKRKADYIKVVQVKQIVGFRVVNSVKSYSSEWTKKYWGHVLFKEMKWLNSSREE